MKIQLQGKLIMIMIERLLILPSRTVLLNYGGLGGERPV
jgi:hypothetical protein